MWWWWSHIDWNQVGGAFTAAAIVLAGLRKLWNAIKKQFTSLVTTLDEKRTGQLKGLKDHVDNTFAKHEALDQRRHEENIERFAEINKTLRDNGLNGKPLARH